VTGREPYPTAVELEEVHYAMRARSVTPRDPRVLPLADARPCPLLSETGQCRIYASRPFGCRTFFCDGAEAPLGEKAKLPREALNALGRRIADLSARFAPHDPHPRPLVRALSSRKG
jgi:Fe-S-cluster containining protein